jgi:cell division protein FtsQ
VSPANRRVKPPQLSLPLPDEPEVQPRRPSRLLSLLRIGGGIALVLSSALGVAWIARRHVMHSPRFAVTEIEVVGNERRSAEAIVAESGIRMDANVFALDLEEARARILADPWLSDAALARRLPGKIRVQVTERKPAAVVTLGDTWLATAAGEPFKRFEPGDPTDLPVISGLSAERAAEDREGTTQTIRRAIDLAAEYEHGLLVRRAPLEEVHVEPNGSFTVVIGRSAVQLVLGTPPYRRKLDQAARVVAELERRGAKPDAIMLDNDARPERVVVRMR